MMKTYTYELSEKDIKQLSKDLAKIGEHLSDNTALYEYLAKKCIKELRNICLENLTTYGEDNVDIRYYMSCNQYAIIDGALWIYNDSTINVSDRNISPLNRANYPATLSLAKMVEYGVGYTGSTTNSSEVEDWEYDVNNHGVTGWYYLNDEGKLVWTNGYTGRLIFAKLKQRVIDNIQSWVSEYVYSIL